MKPNRSILSVPGHVEKMHGKALASKVDVVMLDLEDSVPLENKEEARKQVIASIHKHDWQEKILSVRINSLDTPFAHRDLLEIVESVGNTINTIVVPKIQNAGDIHFVSRLLDSLELELEIDRPIRIEASIETAEGMENCTEIAGASPRLVSLVFGIADYSASVGARLVSISGHGETEEDIYPGHRWHFPLSRMVMTAKAHGLMAIDAPFGNFRDNMGLRKSAALSCALGCDGKWAIHPAQVEEINNVFSPSREEIELAAKVLEASRNARSSGKGAVAVEGRMVDQATVRLASKLWEQAKHLGLIPRKI